MPDVARLMRGPDVPSGSISASSPSLAVLRQTPGVLRHLQRLTAYLPNAQSPTAYVHIYARRPGQKHGEHLHDFAPPLDTFTARDSGLEGIACVDDVARAVVLACHVFELTGSSVARELAMDWSRFLIFMQDRNDDRRLNFILDANGWKNEDGQTSNPGGEPWTIRSLCAWSTFWRVFHERGSLRRFQWALFPATGEMPYIANYALAIMDLLETRPDDRGLRVWIEDMCTMIIASGPRYFRTVCGQDEGSLFDYHQLQAVARAGRLLGHADYIAACEETVAHLVEPVIREGFYHVYPTQRDHKSVFDVSSLAEGLEALFHATENPHYRELALNCCAWLDGNNPAKAPVYDPETGRCHDNVNLKGAIAPTIGAELAIEAGNLHLVRVRLAGTKAGLDVSL